MDIIIEVLNDIITQIEQTSGKRKRTCSEDSLFDCDAESVDSDEVLEYTVVTKRRKFIVKP
jgi:hypothetical protein